MSLQAAIDLGALRLPRSEHRADRTPELVVHVLREGLAPLLVDQRLVFDDQRLEILGGHVGVEEIALIFLRDFKRFLETVMIQLEHDVGIHLDEAAIAVPGETRIARGLGKALHRRVVEAEIEHRIHHARHRGARAGADRDEQRIGRIAEFLAGHALDMARCRWRLRRAGLRETGRPRRNRRAQNSVEMVKPGGTGRPIEAISARFAPLPPSRFRSPLPPSETPRRSGKRTASLLSPLCACVFAGEARQTWCWSGRPCVRQPSISGEVGNRMDRIAHPREQREARFALDGVGIVDGYVVEEAVDRGAERG